MPLHEVKGKERKWYLLEINGGRIVAWTDEDLKEDSAICLFHDPMMVSIMPVPVPARVNVATIGGGAPQMELAFTVNLVPYPVSRLEVMVDLVPSITPIHVEDSFMGTIKACCP